MAEIIFSEHAREQMVERGCTEAEVRAAIERGEREPTRGNRTMYRNNFRFEDRWRDKYYRIKQVVPVATEESDRLVVVTVYVFYFQGEQR